MKVLIFKYPRNMITDILISLFCIFLIIIVLQYDSYVNVSSSDYTDVLPEEYLKSFGWEIDTESKEIDEFILTDEKIRDFPDFNRIQIEQGFILESYIGKKITRFTYNILNYPGYEKSDSIFAAVFIFDNTIIAADIYSSSINGFMTGVKRNSA